MEAEGTTGYFRCFFPISTRWAAENTNLCTYHESHPTPHLVLRAWNRHTGSQPVYSAINPKIFHQDSVINFLYNIPVMKFLSFSSFTYCSSHLKRLPKQMARVHYRLGASTRHHSIAPFPPSVYFPARHDSHLPGQSMLRRTLLLVEDEQSTAHWLRLTLLSKHCCPNTLSVPFVRTWYYTVDHAATRCR